MSLPHERCCQPLITQMRPADRLLSGPALFSACNPIPIPDHEFRCPGSPASGFEAGLQVPSGTRPMQPLSRREFLAASGAVICGGLASPGSSGLFANQADAPLKFKLGLVTYNVPKDWDLPTLLKVCKDVGVAAVECRTTHKHGVEPSLTAEQRKAVRKQFEDSGVVFWGCGSVCEFHAADPAVVRKNVETCKQFVGL